MEYSRGLSFFCRRVTEMRHLRREEAFRYEGRPRVRGAATQERSKRLADGEENPIRKEWSSMKNARDFSNTRHLLPEELADRLRVSTVTLRQWRYLGRGPKFISLYQQTVYPLAEVERWENYRLKQKADEPNNAP